MNDRRRSQDEFWIEFIRKYDSGQNFKILFSEQQRIINEFSDWHRQYDEEERVKDSRHNYFVFLAMVTWITFFIVRAVSDRLVIKWNGLDHITDLKVSLDSQLNFKALTMPY